MVVICSATTREISDEIPGLRGSGARMPQMKSHFLAPFLLLMSSALALAAPPGKAQDDPIPPAGMTEKAKDLVAIRGKGMPGFRMFGDLRIWVKKDSPADGKYLLVWTPEGRWREEIVFKGYNRLRIGDGKHFWQVRSMDQEYAPIFELERLMDVSRELKHQEGARLSPSRPQKIDGQEADCIKRERSGFTESLCFDSKSGALLRYVPVGKLDVPLRFRSKQYSQFQQWTDKIYPRTMRGFDGEKPMFEVKLEEIKPLPELPTDFFAPPNDSIRWADCAEGGMWKSKERVQPVYPESARVRGIEGIVVLGGVIEEDGTVSNLRLAFPTGTELDQAAVSAVSRWRYERDSCPMAEGRMETLIDVVFQLSR